jgi:hypothetical protein
MRKSQAWIASLSAVTALAGAAPASANALPFTWDPGGAPTSLGGSALTADTIDITGYVRDVAQPDGTHVAHRFEVITGFSLNGAAVLPAGFGSLYGLYFEFADQGTGGPPPHILNFTSVGLALKADPGNHNGQVSSTVSGIDFANTGPTGAADDIVLATGSLVTGSLFLNTTAGTVHGSILQTFVPLSGQVGFFSGGSGLLDFDALNPASLLVMTPGPGGTTTTNFNDYAVTAQFVPEPGSIALLGIGLLGLVPLSRQCSDRATPSTWHRSRLSTNRQRLAGHLAAGDKPPHAVVQLAEHHHRRPIVREEFLRGVTPVGRLIRGLPILPITGIMNDSQTAKG